MRNFKPNRLKLGIFAWAIIALALSIGVLAPARPAAAHGRPAILLYHHIDRGRGVWHVTPAKFEAQLKYLAENGYQSVSMHDYLGALQNGTTLPAKSVVLTFDDSFADHFTTVFPLLQRYGFHGMFFIITGRVGLKGYLTWDQIAQMQAAGMEIGAHTVHHPFLSQIPPLHALIEIAFSRKDLIDHLGAAPEFFAYPYNDRSRVTANLVRLTGFAAALAVSPHTTDAPDDPFTIPRATITSGEGMRTFTRIVTRGG